ncbi:hypothetical protein [Leptospira interrogans]|nr:hypothetical protein [Leptospira interrogans]EKN87862.1 hypothetical protein LEP1GSC027_2919 [Leptospira interrogans str. 2002000624]EKQ37674.1 hypothetical protein LEP1GSC025_0995 [Leptospira interrogans str. 2002000621]EKQ46397.1 hypothetical protein LEP1GSC026_1158 [Leptospira interrogans str. 2002000623]EMJ75869.1 hypothetical protein LEP1GSC033_3051 [Leptospira interrogans str. 2002000632]EMJ84116.1 hypothetical protein LEP1GSC032_0366 [Leptospira interrogans str. 2002000631]
MNERKVEPGFVLGEAVRNRVTGQKMYVDANWNPEVSCVYFDTARNSLVKVDVLPDDLEKVEELLWKRV